jgi:hypothetical protein
MKGCMFNIDNGYLEGLCRGFKNGILRQADYLNLVQCETLEDLKLHLQVPVLRIHDILVWIRIRGSMPLTNGSGCCYFHH